MLASIPARRSSILALVLSLVVALPVSAAPPSSEASEPAEPPSDDVAAAETLHLRGQAKYETADYAGAIELWTEAYASITPVPENAGIKAALIFNLAQAHVKAFELDEDPIHLKQARALLDSYAANLEQLYEDEAARTEEQAKVDERLAEIQAKIDALAAAEPEPAPDVVTPEPPAPQADGKPGRGLIIGGSVITGVGALFFGAAVIGGVVGAGANDISDLEPSQLDEREDRFRTGTIGNAMMTTGIVIAAVLVPTGAALLGVGVARNRKAGAGARARARVPTLAPSFAKGSVGVVLGGRF